MWELAHKEGWRIDVFELWCWKRLLRVPWTARRLSQSILKETHSEYSLEGLMLKLKLQYFGHVLRRTESLETTWFIGKDRDAGKNWGQEEKGTTEDKRVGWHHWLNGCEFEHTQGDSIGQRSLACCSSWSSRVGHDLVTKQQCLMKVKVKSLSRVWLFATPWTVFYQASLSMGFPGKSTGMGCYFLLQGIFLTQGSNPGLLHCRQTLYPLSHQGSLYIFRIYWKST